MEPTAEQLDAIALSVRSESMKLVAFAGAGKTATLVMIANKLKELGRNGMYLAFNSSIAKEAVKKMPSNVESRTMHSMAYRASPDWVISRLNDNGLTGKAFSDYHKLKKIWVSATTKTKRSSKKEKNKMILSPNHQKKIIDEGLNEFMRTSARKPGKRHLRTAMDKLFDYVEDNDKDYVVGRLYPTVLAIWGDYIDPNGELGYDSNHDVYLKMWALTQPKIDTDFILFDEAQDANPIFTGILLQQRCPVIYVGDPHQQIYEWRGAKNAMQTLDVPARYLTKSFRFGDNLAKFCQPILNYLGEKNTFKGLKDVHTTIDSISKDPKDINVALCRTNIGAIEMMLKLSSKGLQAVPSNLNIKNTVRMLDALNDFKDDPSSQSHHPILRNFKDYDDLLKYNDEYYGDQSVAPFIALYEKYEYQDIKSTLNRCLRMEKAGNWDIQVTTAHRAKGMEWDCVYIHEDFLEQFFNRDGSPKDANDEEYRLLYVTITRARKKLYAANIKKIMTLLSSK